MEYITLPGLPLSPVATAPGTDAGTPVCGELKQHPEMIKVDALLGLPRLNAKFNGVGAKKK